MSPTDVLLLHPVEHQQELVRLLANAAFQAQQGEVATVLFRPPGEVYVRCFQGAEQEPSAEGECFMFQPFRSADAPGFVPALPASTSISVPPDTHVPCFPQGRATDKHEKPSADYRRQVADALEAIQAGRLVKIVPARSKSIALPEGFSPQHFFLRLCAYYPQAAITALVHPRWGTWLGASPELLLRQKDAALETMALAGTRVSSDGQPPSFSPKEKAEQARVAEFIREQLEDHWLRYTQSPPQPVPAGPVWHLMSRFHARWHRSEPALALAQALHPTPAVCGLPRDAALAFLASEEGLDRRLYSGFWGPVGPREMALFVNLRCMELHGRGASLYAGAGVVEGSEPEAEWQETERKMDTLASFLEPAAS